MLLAKSSLGFKVINDTSITIGAASAPERQSGEAVAPAGTTAPASPTGASSKNATAASKHLPLGNDNLQLEELIVTGTHISGVAPIGAPIVVYTREDANQSGAATLDQFARVMTDNFASVDTIANQYSNVRLSPTGVSNGTNTFQGAAFNLRGLGPTATLTLLNGRRLAPGGLDGSFTDISQIPLSIVDHIEVLPDGASAIYGADAVAGVVNIITRNDFKGVESAVRYGSTTEGERVKSRHRNFLASLGAPVISFSTMTMTINRV